MLFNSLGFLYFFLPVTYFVFWALRSRTQRYVWLTITGYVFYSFWNYKFCALMALSTLISYLAGIALLKYRDPRIRRRCLVIPIVCDLTLLGVFKYANFTLATFHSLGEALHVPIQVPHLDIVLPVGISFYTFHTITYIVDCHKERITPTRNLFEFSCYVSLFSQLVAGPIVRFREIENDLAQIDKQDSREMRERGWSFFAIGMIKKVLIADSIAAVINPGLANWSALSSVSAWLCVVGYCYQIYFDFSGYSDMAVGLGLLFGLRLPQNFNSPFKAVDMADFWARWHISFSNVMRDYVFFPLGGSRGSPFAAYRNIMITMLLVGLWHGANWTFVCWGIYHGVLLSLSRWGAPALKLWPQPVRMAGTFMAFVIGAPLFCSSDLLTAVHLWKRMFTWYSGQPLAGWTFLLALLILSAGLSHFGPNTFEMKHRWSGGAGVGLGLLFAGCLAVLYAGQASPFLYFQF